MVKNTDIVNIGLVMPSLVYGIYGILFIAGWLGYYFHIKPLLFLLEAFRFPYNSITFGSTILISLTITLLGLFYKHPFSIWQKLDKYTLICTVISMTAGLSGLGLITFLTLNPIFSFFQLSHGLFLVLFTLSCTFISFHAILNLAAFLVNEESLNKQPVRRNTLKKLIIQYLSKETVSQKFDSEFFSYNQIGDVIFALETILENKKLKRDNKWLCVKNIVLKYPKILYEVPETLLELTQEHINLSGEEIMDLYVSSIECQAFKAYIKSKKFEELLSLYIDHAEVLFPTLSSNINEESQVKDKLFKATLGNESLFKDQALLMKHVYEEEVKKIKNYLSTKQKAVLHQKLMSMNPSIMKIDNINALGNMTFGDIFSTDQQKALIKKLATFFTSQRKVETEIKIEVLEILTKFYNKHYKNKYNLKVTLEDLKHFRIEDLILGTLLKKLRDDGENEKANNIEKKLNLFTNEHCIELYEYHRKPLENELTAINIEYHGKEQKPSKEEEEFKDILQSNQAILFNSFCKDQSNKATQWLYRRQKCISEKQANRLGKILSSPEAISALFLHRYDSSQNAYQNFMRQFLEVLRFLNTTKHQNEFLKNYLFESFKKEPENKRRRLKRSPKTKKPMLNIFHMVKKRVAWSSAIIHAIEDKKMKNDFLNHTFYASSHDIRKEILPEQLEDEDNDYLGAFEFLVHEPKKSCPDPQAHQYVIKESDKKEYSIRENDERTYGFRLFQIMKIRYLDQKTFLKDLLHVVNLMKLSYFIKEADFELQKLEKAGKKVRSSKMSPIAKQLILARQSTAEGGKETLIGIIKALDTAFTKAQHSLKAITKIIANSMPISVDSESEIEVPTRATEIKRAVDLYQDYTTDFDQYENRVKDIQLFGRYVDCKSKILGN